MASMKPTLLIFTGLTVAFALPAYADFGVGQRVPAPTAAGQSVTSTPTAPFTWTPVTLPYGLNATGQMAVGGTVDATTRLSVNPQGTAENGLTVNMPSGATGNEYQGKTSTGTVNYYVKSDGTVCPTRVGINHGGSASWCQVNQCPNNSVGGLIILPNSASGAPLISAAGLLVNSDGSLRVTGGGSQGAEFVADVSSQSSTTVRGVLLKAISGQSVPLFETRTSADVTCYKIDPNGLVTAPALLTAISTKTAAYTLTATDTTILMNGAFAVTLPAASAALAGHSWTVKQIGAASSTVVGTVDGNTAGYTLAAQFNFVTIICDGTNYWITGKG